MVADAAHDVAECPNVLVGERVEEQIPYNLNVAGQDLGDTGRPSLGDADDRRALICRTRLARDEFGLLQ